MDFESVKQNKFEIKFEIKKENIIASPELPKDFSSDLKTLGWPVEVQGTGRVLEDGKNFEIRYPEGDVFYSWAVIIHELGHLRQDELSDSIRNEQNEYVKNLKKEKDAFDRGLNRVKKYFPEILEDLEIKFKQFKKEGKISDFFSFDDLFNDFKNVIKINEVLGTDDEEDLKIEKLKNSGIEDFFRKMERNKVGIKIDVCKANNIIFKIAANIAEE